MRYTVQIPESGWQQDSIRWDAPEGVASRSIVTASEPLENGVKLEVDLIRYDDGRYVIEEAALVDSTNAILDYINPRLVALKDADGQPVAASHDPLWDTLTTAEAEALCGLAKGTVKKACQRGDIPCRKSGGVWLVTFEDVAARWPIKGSHSRRRTKGCHRPHA